MAGSRPCDLWPLWRFRRDGSRQDGQLGNPESQLRVVQTFSGDKKITHKKWRPVWPVRVDEIINGSPFPELWCLSPG